VTPSNERTLVRESAVEMQSSWPGQARGVEAKGRRMKCWAGRSRGCRVRESAP